MKIKLYLFCFLLLSSVSLFAQTLTYADQDQTAVVTMVKDAAVFNSKPAYMGNGVFEGVTYHYFIQWCPNYNNLGFGAWIISSLEENSRGNICAAGYKYWINKMNTPAPPGRNAGGWDAAATGNPGAPNTGALQLSGDGIYGSTTISGTTSQSAITVTSAALGGQVLTNYGDNHVRGVVYSSSQTTPTLGASGVINAAMGTGEGTYSATVSGLSPSTTYYARSYTSVTWTTFAVAPATGVSTTNVVYGNVTSFTTPTPTITASATSAIPATTFGTTSGTGSFTVSGVNMVAGITATAPAGFEVSLNSTSGFASSVVVGAAGTISSTPVYVRLASTKAAGSYTVNVNLTSTSAPTQTSAITAATVNTYPITIKADNTSKNYGTSLSGSSGSTAYAITSGTLQNGNTISSVSLTLGTGAAANANVGTYSGTLMPSAAVGANGFLTSNYNITYAGGNIIVNSIPLTYNAQTATRIYGAANPTFSGALTGFVNSETEANVTTGTLVFSSSANATSPAGQYAINGSGKTANNGNYTFVQAAGNSTALTITNAPPVLANGSTLNYTENDAATAINTLITLTDAENNNITGATVTITSNFSSAQDVLSFTNQNGITGSYNNGTLTLSGTTSPANYQTALRTVAYRNSSDNPLTSARTVVFQVSDGNLSNSISSTVNITAVNDLPVVTAGATVSYTEQGTAPLIGNGITISDVDHTTLTGAVVTIASAVAGDVLSFTNQNGISGSYVGGVLTLSGAASLANYQTALRSVRFASTSDDLTVNGTRTSRTISFTVNDGIDNSSPVNSTVNITAVNDAPVVTAGATVSYTEQGTSAVIDNGITVSDLDNTTLTGGIVTIVSAVAGDVLSFSTQNGISGSFANGVLTLSGATTLANYQAALRSVQFSSTSDNPTVNGTRTSRTIQFIVNDGIDNSSPVNSTVNIAAVNDLPVVTAGATVSYTEQGTAPVIDNSIAISDLDDATLTGAVVTIASAVAGDVLSFTTQNGISGSYVGGVLTLSGTASLANYQTALRSVRFASTSDNPTVNGTRTSRTIQFIVNDGTDDSSPVSSTVNITAINDAPIVTAGATVSYTEQGTSAVIDNGITVSDLDNTTLTGAIVTIASAVAGDVLSFTTQNGISGSFASGVLTLSGTASLANYQVALRSVQFSSTSDNPTVNGTRTSRTIQFIVNDGTDNSSQVNSTVNITSVNDLPVVTAGATVSYTEQGTALVIDNSIVISDLDDATLTGAVVTITSAVAGDLLSFTNQNGISGTYAGGVLTLSGTASLANYQTALHSVQFSSTSDNPTVNGTRTSRTIQFIVNDGTSDSSPVNSTVNITAVNDAPVLASTSILSYTENDVATAINNNITVSDPDHTTLSTASVSITGNFVSSEDVLSFTGDGATMGNIIGVYSATTGVMSLSSSGGTATLAQWQVALRAVLYSNSSNNPSVLARTVAFLINDGETNSNIITSTINITAINTPPTVANIILPQTATEGLAFNFAFAANTFNDVDNNLTYTARLVGGAPLPSWLTLTSATRSFSGTPSSSDIGMLAIEVIADDGSATIATNFNLTVDPANRDITSATYNGISGVLTVTGTYFKANASGADIDLSKFTITGEDGTLHVLTTSNIEITNATTFSATLNTTDKAALAALFTKNGLVSRNGTTYNIAAASDWMMAAPGFADLAGNGITVADVTEIPVVALTATSGITPYTATLNGTIDPKLGNITAGAFVVSKNANLSNPITVPAFSPSSGSIVGNMPATAVSTSLTGLTSKTTYYYQLAATNSAGEGKSSIQSFLTLPSINADLTSLVLNNGAVLDPVFTAGNQTYTAAVGNAVVNVQVTPTLAENTGTIKVNNTTVANASASSDLALTVGLNTITTVVTAEDASTTKTYTITVNRRAAQTISFATTATTTFGTADFDPGASSTNTGIPIVYTTSDVNVATIVAGKVHIVGAGVVTISANQAGDVNHDAAVTATQSLTINKASQVITFAALPNKTFNDAAFNLSSTGGGSNNAITYVSSNTAVATISGNQVTIVGAGTTIIKASQLGNDNYLDAPNVEQSFTVDKATVTLSLSDLVYTYDGSAKSATVTTSPNGLSGVSITYNGSLTAPTAAGTYPIVVQLTHDNYTAINATGDLIINKLGIAVSAVAKSKAYGEVDPALTYTFTPALVSGDSFTGDISRAAGENFGNYAIGQGTLALSSNYILTYTGADLSIGKKVISVSAVAKSKIYGAVDPALTYTFTPALVSGDLFTGDISRAAGENIGNYAIGQGTLALSSNYTLNYTGADLVIDKQIIAVVAIAKSKIYGAVDPALTYTFSPALVSGDVFIGDISRAAGENIGNYAIGQGSLALNLNYTLNYTGADLVIGKQTISVVAAAKSKTYGAADPALTYTFSPALVSGDSFTGDISRAVGENIGNYAIGQGTLALSSNYILNYTGADLVIGKQTIAVSAIAKSKTYGAVDPALTYTFTPALVSGDSFTGDISRAAGENIGNYTIGQGTLALNSNYTLNYTGADLSIGKQTIAVAAVAKNKAYGEVDPALTYTFTPVLVSGDSFTGDISRAAGENIGNYAIGQGTLALSSNYILTYTGADLVIGKQTITVVAAAKSKTYGAVDPVLTYTFTPALVSGDTFTGDISRAVGENIGNYAIGQGTLALSNNYILTYTGADLVIGKQTISVAAVAKSKIYGAVDPALTYTFTPALVNGDTFTGDISRAVGENIGNYAIGQGTLALNSNYTLNYTGADLSIDKQTIAVTAIAKSKTYGAVDPALTYTFTPALVSGDTFTGDISRAVGENIGNYAIGQGTLALSSNYTLNYTGADLVIDKQTIVVTAAAKSKIYGAVDPALTYTFSPVLVSGDTFTGDISRAAGENIGNYAIGQGTLALNSNYILTYTGADLSIGKQTIAVTAVAKSKVYGAVDPALTYTFTPALVTGDSFTGDISRTVGENIGNYAIGQGSLALNSNYILTYTGADLAIGKQTIAVVAVAKNKTYGDADPALTYTFTPALVTGDTFTGDISRAVGENIGNYAIGQGTLALNSNYILTYTGADLVIGKQTIAVAAVAKSKIYGAVDPALTYTFTPALVSGDTFTGDISRAVGENIGNYAIGQGTLALNSNYTLNYTGADLSIDKQTIAVTAVAKSKTYGAVDPALTYTFTPALVSGDTFTGDISRAVGENIGNYAIGQGTLALNSNYTLNYTGADLVISKQTIAVIAAAKSKIYGEADPTLTYTFSPALVSGDSFIGDINRAVGENIGNYAIGQGSLALSNNYILTYTGADLVIGKQTIAVAAVAKSKIYGAVDPALTYTFTPALVSGDTFTGDISRAVGENIGNYAIGQGSLALNSNYILTYTGADLVIGKQTIAVAAVAKSKIYGEVDPTLTYTFSPVLVSGDSFTGDISRAVGENIGNYAIGQGSLALNSNYILTYTGADLVIGKQTIAVVAAAKSKTYGAADPALTYTFTPSLVSGDTFTGDISRAVGENIGNYAIGQGSLALNNNYILTYTGADLVIGKQTIAVVAAAKSKTYGDIDPVLTYTFTPALVSGDTFTGDISRSVGENIGNYAIAQGTLALSPNYTLNYTSADLVIGKQTIAVTAAAKSKTYGAVDPALTYTFTPALVTGDTFTGDISRAVGENIGNYAIGQGSLALSNNYILTYGGADLVIGKQTIAVAAVAKSKIYGEVDPTLTYTFSPALVSGDTFTGDISRTVGENIGNYAIGQGTLALSSNYILSYIGADLVIGKQTITVVATAKSKTYGAVDPALTYTFTPALVSGDTFTGDISRAVGENIGNYAIGQGTLALNSNYILTYTGADLVIGKQTIVVAAVAKSKIYGEVDPALTYTFTPALVSGDTFTGDISRAVGENIGNYAIGQGSLALSNNYILTYTGADLVIGKQTIAVVAVAKSKIYGAVDPVLTYTFTPALVSGDSFTGDISRAVGENIGNYAIGQGTLALNPNYTLNYTTADLVIGKQTIAVIAVAKSKTYGAVDPSLTYTFTPALVTGDTFTGDISRAVGESIGNYAIGQGTLALSSNYTLNYTGADLVIGKQTITVVAAAKNKIYGSVDPALTYTFTPALVTGDSFTGDISRAAGENIGNYAIGQGSLALSNNYILTYTGADLVIGKQTIAVAAVAKNKIYGAVDPALTYTFTPALVSGDSFTGDISRAVGENIGNYAIGQGSLALSNNYILTYTGADLVIGKQTITVVAAAKNKIYGTVDPSLTYTFTPALVTGDTFTGDISRAVGENIGNYAIGQGTLALSPNYTLNYSGADLVIGKQTITVVAAAKSKIYGAVDPALTYTFTPALVTGDAFTGDISRAAGENIGNYAIGQGTLALSNNYILNYTGADLVIGKQTIAVVAAAKSKIYGAVDPALTYTFSPALVSGDSFTGDISRAVGENIGNYAIGQGSLALSNNYILTYTGADLVIGKQTIAVVAGAKSKTYGAVDPVLTYTFTPALVTGDSFTGDISRAVGENIGNYAIGQGSLALSNNYILTYTGANLVIGKQTIAVVAAAKSKIYGEADPALTYTFTPALVSGDSFTGDISRAVGENIGNYAIGQGTLALNSNYILTYAGADLVIGKQTITVAAVTKSKIYGEADPALTYTFTPALVSGDSFTGGLSRVVGESIGSYAIGQGNLVLSNNYILTYTGADLVISKQTIAVVAAAKSKIYGETDPALTYTFTPALVAGDAFTGDISRAAGENIGNYAIGQGTLVLNSNYTLNYTSADFIINVKAVVVTADPKNKIYGDVDPTLTYTAVPTLKTGDTFTGSLTRAIGNNVGNYAITQGTLTAGNNYAISYHTKDLIIAAKAVTVTADAKVKTYGDSDPNLTYTISPVLVIGDVINGELSRAIGENVANYAINKNTLTLGSNYLLNFVSDNLVINKKELSITADHKSKIFNDVNPVLTASYSGFVNSETAAILNTPVVLSTTAIISSSPGTYPIEVSGATANNYNINFVQGTLTIAANSQIITFGALSDKLSTDAPFSLTASSSVGLAISYSSSDPTIARIINSNQVEILKAGTVIITASQPGNINYAAANSVTQSLRIVNNQLPVIAIASDLGTSIIKGETAKLTATGALTYVWSAANGIIAGQNTAILTVRPLVNTTYTVTGANQFGLTATQTITIAVRDDLQVVTVTPSATNIISPNGDGVNDFFVVKNIDAYPNNTVTIFDRGGKVLHKVKSYKNNWDGSINGLILEEGTYYYIIEFGDGKTNAKKGFITIVKD